MGAAEVVRAELEAAVATDAGNGQWKMRVLLMQAIILATGVHVV